MQGEVIGLRRQHRQCQLRAPHLHFAVSVLGPEKQWWQGTSINPYGRFEGQQPAQAASAIQP